jgi:hypothetical protein
MKSTLRPGNGELLPKRAFYAALGQVLRAHRMRLSWSLARLADRIGWRSAATITRAEQGELLGMHLICAMASEFSVNPADMLREAAAIVQRACPCVNRG